MNEQEKIDVWLRVLSERALTADESVELNELLKQSPVALDRYLDHCDVEQWLTAAGDSLQVNADGVDDAVVAMPTADDGDNESEQNGGSRWGVLAAIAAVLAAAAVVMVMVNRDGEGGLVERSADEPENLFEPNGSAAESDGAKLSDGDLLAEVKAGDQEVAVAAAPDPWKVINATGSVSHPGKKDQPVPVSMPTRPIKFNRDIRPILSETCFHCHGPDEHGRRADLRLDSQEGAMADLGGTKAIEPGDLENSEAWWRIISDDPDELMPPPESHLVLTDAQKQLIKRWIEEGAEYEGHWAYVAPKKAELPKAEGAGNEIDGFVRARLEEEGLSPAKEADPRTLIRRLTFDLTGLPPQHEEVAQFLKAYEANGEQAWQDAITRLLASPHFGERMTVPWLDQARYADTNGYSIDGGRHMWLWRDWVIQAYNENMPFDRFLLEQLAGDLIPEATPAQLVASGFNRNHMITHEGGTIPAENLTNYAADRVKTTSEVFLGLTMACAQCHDHKYDPISAKEYYEFFSFFNELSDKGNDGNAGINAGPKINAKTVIPSEGERKEIQAELAEAKQALLAHRDRYDAWLKAVRQEEAQRGQGFQVVTLQTLDASTPNRPGPFSVLDDGSVRATEPSKGLNAFSHVLELPQGAPVEGVRVSFFPVKQADGKELFTPHAEGVPMVSTMLISASDQQAKQVEVYKQLALKRATASSRAGDNRPEGVLDERNLDWWQPEASDAEPHLTITFDEAVDPAQTPYLSVMLFFGRPQSMPYHWRIDAIRGDDEDSRFAADLATLIQKPAADLTDDDQEKLLAAYREDESSLEPLRVRIANLEDRLKVLTEEHPAMVMDTAAKPRETFVLDRGQYDAPTLKVSGNTPRVLPELPGDGDAAATRLDLAEWMVQPEHPLTSRVAVNRLWAVFFGTGIVSTTADFGSQGEWPSHPELLDWLAVDFVESGWDQKALIRKIVSSATYRQDSSATAQQREHDPGNRLLARGPRFRLAAEFIRDQALALSGLLVPRVGGPSVQPYQPSGLWKEVSHFGSTPATKQVFVQDKGEKLYRRSLYTIVKRTSPSPGMSAFDAPNREMCITERGVTNTPLQALVTLNDPQYAEAARVFAGQLLAETAGASDADRLRIGFEKITGRLPREPELNAMVSFLGTEFERFQGDPAAAKSAVQVGDSPVAQGVDATAHAAWTQVSALLMNLSETLTRS